MLAGYPPALRYALALPSIVKQEKTDDSFNLNRCALLASARDAQIKDTTDENET
jgi:hypothetical protein